MAGKDITGKDLISIPEKLQPYVNDYKLNIVQICDLPRETIDKFKSEFRVVADYFWQMKHNEEYHPDETEVKYIHEILAMIAAYGGDRNILDNFFRVKGKMEVRSLSDMMKNTLKKSKDEGIAEGLAKGRAEGEAKKEHSFVVEMLQEKEPVAKIMKFTKMSMEKIQEIAKSIGVAVVM